MEYIPATDLFSVSGLVAVITGGGSGLGLMMAKALAANGAYKVFIVGRRKEVLEEAAAACPTGNIIPLPGDVSSKRSLEQIAARVKSEVGFINLLIANSGIGGPSVPRLPEGTDISEFVKAMWETPMEDFTKTLEVNVTGTLYTVLAFLELLDAGNEMGNLDEKISSQVIGMSSIAGFNRSAGAGFAYNSSKAACTHMMKMLATYLVPWNIRCNILAPGVFQSDLTTQLIRFGSKGRSGGQFIFDKSFIPAQRTGDEDDMAGAVLYLASKAGAYCNGSVVLMDGGRLGMLQATY